MNIKRNMLTKFSHAQNKKVGCQYFRIKLTKTLDFGLQIANSPKENFYVISLLVQLALHMYQF